MYFLHNFYISEYFLLLHFIYYYILFIFILEVYFLFFLIKFLTKNVVNISTRNKSSVMFMCAKSNFSNILEVSNEPTFTLRCGGTPTEPVI